MFNTLTLSHFGRYEEADFNFADGINVVRGQSEAGKSTMLRGLLYAIGGVRATGLAADELVRWGSRPAQMKAEMTLRIDGVTYTVKRAPSGAEVWYSGRNEPDVVGQTEVTDFVLRLIGTDLDGLKNLMFSTQNSMRGALEDGPAATVALIEQLANLGQVDSLVSLVAEKLPAGATTAIDSRIALLDGQVADLKVKSYDVSGYNAELCELEKRLAELRDLEMPDLQSRMDEARLLLAQRDSLKAQASQRERDLQRAAGEVAAAARQVAEVEAEAALEVPGSVDTLRAQLEDAERFAERSRAYEAVKIHLDLPDLHWDDNEASLKAALGEARSELAAGQASLAEHDKAIAVAKSRITNAKNCTYCGKDVSQLPEVAASNAALLAELETRGSEAGKLVDTCQRLKADIRVYEQLLEAQAQRNRALSKYSSYVTLSDTTVPVSVAWVGEVPGENIPDVAGYRKALEAAEQVEARKARAAGRLSDLKAAEAAARGRLADLEALPPLNYDPTNFQKAEEDATQLSKALEDLAAEARRMNARAQEIHKAVAGVEAQRAADAQLLQSLEAQIKQAEVEKGEMEDNNQLIKDLRRIRPLVAERVWNMVLAAVSAYFTEMRGEDSVVTREGRSFTVNGRSIAGLSGSTKDILGLAIRMALTRTFLPTARFLVLDEPWAACDVQRSQRCLGFLQSSGFDQILLVTHEDSSEAVADHLINL